jgi:hypothetical protein
MSDVSSPAASVFRDGAGSVLPETLRDSVLNFASFVAVGLGCGGRARLWRSSSRQVAVALPALEG